MVRPKPMPPLKLRGPTRGSHSIGWLPPVMSERLTLFHLRSNAVRKIAGGFQELDQ